MSMGSFSVTQPDPPNFRPGPILSADHKQNTDPTRPAYDDAKSLIFKIQY